MESDTGFCVSKVYTGQECDYYAWSRPEPRESIVAQLRVRYALNERIPQSRVILGVFKSANEAQRCCEAAA